MVEEVQCFWNGKLVSAAEFHARKFCACGNHKEADKPVCKVCLPKWLAAAGKGRRKER